MSGDQSTAAGQPSWATSLTLLVMIDRPDHWALRAGVGSRRREVVGTGCGVRVGVVVAIAFPGSGNGMVVVVSEKEVNEER